MIVIATGLDMGRSNSLVLLIINKADRLTDRKLFIVQIQFGNDAFDDLVLIVAIQDLKVLSEVSFGPMGS